MRRLALPGAIQWAFALAMILAAAPTPSAGQQKPTATEGQVNVRAFGAKGNGEVDDSAALQAAIDSVAAAGGGTVFLPPGTFLVANPLQLRSGVSLRGSGIDITFIRDHKDLAKKSLVSIKGSARARTGRIRIAGITFRNGTATTGTYVPGKDAIRADYVDNVIIEDCKFTEVQGGYCVAFKFARNVTVQLCQFYRWTHAALYVFVESENIRVFDNLFDTVLSTDVNVFAFGTGAEEKGEGEFLLKNLWVQRNVIRNNPQWEGINTYGGENIWIQDNYIDSCKVGILASIMKPGYVTRPVLRNVFIQNNQLVRGSAQPDGSGIQLSSLSEEYSSSNAHITRNSITGFGHRNKSYVSSPILLNAARHVEVTENVIDQYPIAAICLYERVADCAIDRNKILDAVGPSKDSVAIWLRHFGLYGIQIRDNLVQPSTRERAPAVFLRTTTPAVSVQLERNTIFDLASPMVYDGAGLPVEQKAGVLPPSLIQKQGDVILTTSGKPGRMVLTPQQGYGSNLREPILAVDVAAGSTSAVIKTAAKDRDYRWLPEGMNIIITGAGSGGRDLATRVLWNSGKTLTLTSPAITGVKQATVTYEPLTFSP